MKKSITMLAALAPFLAIIAADKPEKSPEEESAEKAARVRAMAAEYAPCTVNVRFRMNPARGMAGRTGGRMRHQRDARAAGHMLP